MALQYTVPSDTNPAGTVVVERTPCPERDVTESRGYQVYFIAIIVHILPYSRRFTISVGVGVSSRTEPDDDVVVVVVGARRS